MISYIWPLALVVLSNVFYQVCAKSVPDKLNPLASLTITYTVGAVISFVLYCLLNHNVSILQEYKKVNWVPFILGMAVVGLEVGYIYAFKVGWAISTAQIVQATILAMILIFVGHFLFKENITWNKIAGIFICLAGLGLINMK